MKVNQVRVEGNEGFPVPNDVELLKFIGPSRCLEFSKIMLARSTTKIHYWKDVTSKNIEVIAKVHRLEFVNQELLKGALCWKFETDEALEEIAVDSTLFKQIVGSLRFIRNSKPDISYAVGLISECNPRASHMAATKHILRYLKETLGLKRDSPLRTRIQTRFQSFHHKESKSVTFARAKNVVVWES
ncbi:hypothetical protein ACSQ67_000762 [Phaseolus vulgaris]